MATTMARMPSTPGAGPSASPISRTASSSSHATSNASASDDEEEWLAPFRSELRRNREARFTELLQQAEAEYRERIAALVTKFPRLSFPGGGTSDASYQAAKAKLDRAFETQKLKIRRLLEQEEQELIERERGLRKLSMGGQVESEEAAALIREQEELLRMYQAKAQQSDSADINRSEKTSLPSTSPQVATWVPPARPVSSQKSNASEVNPSVSRDRRGNSAVPKPNASITEDLFASRNHQSPSQPQGTRYSPWDAGFLSSSGIHEEPREMSDTESDDKTDRRSDNGDGEEDGGSVSEGDASGSDDELSMAGAAILTAERACSVPTKTAPLNILRGGLGGNPQPSSRGRNRMTGRTPPSAMSMQQSANNTALNTQSYFQGASYKNNDAQHRLWKPSQENMRQQSMNRRPSFVDPSLREQEKLREADRTWAEHESSRPRYATGMTSGQLGTSVSPPTHGLAQASFIPSSAAAFAQSQRSAEVPARIWKPPENKGSTPLVSNVYVTTGSSGTVSSFTPTASPAPSVHSYRRRNDSDTSAGSPGRRPSQHQSQITQPASSPRTSLPINTPAVGASRRSPIPAPDSYATSASPPISTPLSTSSSRRSIHAPRPPSPPPLPIPINTPRSSLSRQPTEVSDSDPIVQEARSFNSMPRVSTKSESTRQALEEEPPIAPPAYGSRTESYRDPAPTSALSERMAKERDRERDADRRQKEREEAINRQAEELRQREEVHRKREAELSARMRCNGFEANEQKERPIEEQQLRRIRDEHLQEQRAEQERKMREEHETALLARESEFKEQQSILEAQRQREADLRSQKERELAEKEEELNKSKREMEEWYRIRQEREIAEQTRQLELLKKKEAELEQQQRLLEAQRQAELAEQRRKEEELGKKIEELKRQQRILQEEQRRKDEREREEALRKKEEEERLAEQRRREDELRAREDELKQKAWDLHQREEALARRRKEEELHAKEEALDRQRRELQAREEELARREEEEERRRKEDNLRKERDLALRRQQDEEDKKRLEVHVLKKLEKEKEEEHRQRRERDDRDRERKERDAMKERDRRRQRELEEERRRQESEQHRRQREEDESVSEEQVGEEPVDLKQQEELFRFFERRKLQSEARKRDPRGTAASSSFSSSIPTSSFSSAAGAFQPGRATSSASSIHSNWSQRSSASSASSGVASDFSRASTGSSASSAWSSSSRPTSTSTGSSRTATGEQPKTTPGAWKTSSGNKPGTAQSPSAAGMGSYTSSSPLSDSEARAHAEWHRKQEENARRQQEQFRRDSLRQEQERLAQATAADAARAGGREQIARAWATYESGWASLKEREHLFFRTIPWPVLRQPSDPEDLTTHAIGSFVLSPAHSDKKSARDRLKEQLLRWHPDRFESKWLTKVVPEDKDLVRRAAGMVVRALNDLNTRESNDPFS